MLGAVFEVVAEANRYFASEEPWKSQDRSGAHATVLYVTVEVLRVVAILLQPVMPAAMGKLLDLLGVAPDERGLRRARAARRRAGSMRRTG